jgi:hypothetical protein
VLLEPLFCARKIRAKPGYFPPESARMIHLFQMGELMQDDVIRHKCRRLNEPPIQRNGSPARTGTPARSLIPHRDVAEREMMQGRQFGNAARQFARRQPPKLAFDRRPKISGYIANAERFRTKQDHARLIARTGSEPHTFTVEENFNAQRPRFQSARPESLAHELFLQPVGIPRNELFCFSQRTTTRNGDTGRALASEPQHVSTCAQVANHLQGNLPGAHRKPVLFQTAAFDWIQAMVSPAATVCRTGKRIADICFLQWIGGVKTKLELHERSKPQTAAAGHPKVGFRPIVGTGDAAHILRCVRVSGISTKSACPSIRCDAPE